MLRTYRHNALSHNSDQVVGYNVKKTFIQGRLLPEAVVVRFFEGRTQYARATEEARAIRAEGDYAVICPVYADGCEGPTY